VKQIQRLAGVELGDPSPRRVRDRSRWFDPGALRGSQHRQELRRADQAPGEARGRRNRDRTTRRSVVEALLDEGLTVYVIPPRQLKALRTRYGSTGAKSDPGDVDVLADVLRTDKRRLKPLTPDSPETRALRALTRTRKGPRRGARWAHEPASGPTGAVLSRRRGTLLRTRLADVDRVSPSLSDRRQGGEADRSASRRVPPSHRILRAQTDRRAPRSRQTGPGGGNHRNRGRGARDLRARPPRRHREAQRPRQRPPGRRRRTPRAPS
jgi:transposase